MEYLSRFALLTVILLLPFSNASAQDNSKPLTLKECIQAAMDNSSLLTIARRNVIASELEVKDAQTGYLPRLNAAAGYNINNTYDKIEWTKDHCNAGLSLTETFYDNGKTPA